MFASGSLASAVLAGAALIGATFLLWACIINRTTLAPRLKRGGYFRCPKYQHRDIMFGSDWSRALRAAVASGTRIPWTRAQFVRYGKTFETNVYGKLTIHTCDPVNAEALLTAPAANAGVGPARRGQVEWLGPGTFSVDGEVWKRSRDLIKPVFKKTAYSDMTRIDRHLNRLLDEVEAEGLEVDLQVHFLRMFLDFTMDMLIGQDINTVNKDFSKFDVASFNAACNAAQLQVVRTPLPWIVRWWNGWTKTWNEPLEATQSFIAQYVDSAVRDAETAQGGPIAREPAFLDRLIREAGTADKNYLRDQMLNVFMPARDSVAVAASYVLLFLARHPAAYAKVRAEVLAAGIVPGQISYDTLNTLPYVNAVVHETMRLTGPANGVTNRDILADTVLPRGGGVAGDQPILVPKGSSVVIWIQTLHRDESVWGPDPDAFRPERWTDSSMIHAHRLAFEYMPFGGGRRICPAMALALGELAFIVTAFAVRFREIQNRDPEERLLEEGAIIMKIRNGVHVKLVK